MSSFFAGAEMITFFTGPRRCFLASFASVKRPVDSITTCAPTDSHGRATGALFFEDLDGLAVDRDAVRTSRNLIGKVAENRVVLQEMGQRFWIRQVIDRDEIQV